MIDEYLRGEESSRRKDLEENTESTLRMALPGAKVDRSSFLATQLWNYCDEQSGQLRASVQAGLGGHIARLDRQAVQTPALSRISAQSIYTHIVCRWIGRAWLPHYAQGLCLPIWRSSTIAPVGSRPRS